MPTARSQFPVRLFLRSISATTENRTETIYLLFPLTASIVFTFGALFVNRASINGVKPFTPVIVANFFAALQFSFFWGLGGEIPDWTLFWQPALIALFFMGGQCSILCALSYGDVSVAAPVASAKVIFVTFLLTVFATITPTTATWLAAIMATLGVVLINFVVPKSGRKRVFFTVLLALLAAVNFACFDVCIQFFSSHWGAGRLVPVSYWFVGLFSLGLLPLIDKPGKLFVSLPWKTVLIAGFLIAAQSGFLVYGLAMFNDAARINVVYSLRGLWGVLLAWSLAGWFGGNEAKLPKQIMIARLCGASLLVVAVVVTILETQSL